MHVFVCVCEHGLLRACMYVLAFTPSERHARTQSNNTKPPVRTQESTPSLSSTCREMCVRARLCVDHACLSHICMSVTHHLLVARWYGATLVCTTGCSAIHRRGTKTHTYAHTNTPRPERTNKQIHTQDGRAETAQREICEVSASASSSMRVCSLHVSACAIVPTSGATIEWLGPHLIRHPRPRRRHPVALLCPRPVWVVCMLACVHTFVCARARVHVYVCATWMCMDGRVSGRLGANVCLCLRPRARA